jgi:TolB-like protein/Tfp pilus assembly protein PilF
MPSEPFSDVKFEIGHVLFIDIVGYSKLLITEQSDQMQTLRQIVRGTAQFKKADAEGKLLRLPTGDGGALVFRNSPEAPVLCALEISKALKSHPELKVRMGVHSGPVNEITDLNEQANIAGAGINIAQRVMDCGDAGHILLSRHVAEDLEHYPRWQAQLHELGECDVKHGIRVSVVNLYNEEVGNPAVPEKFKKAPEVTSSAQATITKSAKPLPTLVLWIVSFAVLAVLFAVFGLGFLRSRNRAPTNTIHSKDSSAAQASSKSIAVLPFENLSRDPENAYFAEGMQDEVLARLSKIADLKVISRTSTQKYKSAPDNLREIAKQLGVANIVEGSVQRAADKVRVNVQLINAVNDTHLWGDIYDRKLTDIFTVESDIAKTIADTLQAKLTGAEEQLIAARPTSDLTAYELYLKGRLLWSKRGGENVRQAIAFYEQAIARDPNYALAYAGIAEAYMVLPRYAETAPQESYPKAKAAAIKALQLDDRLAEAHNALGFVLWVGDFDMAGSISEFQRAIALDPNSANAHKWFGNPTLVASGRFDEAIKEIKRGAELDPLSTIMNSDLGWTLMLARRYDEAIAQLHKTLELDPTFYYAHLNLGLTFQLKGDLSAALAEYAKAQKLSDDPEIRVRLATAKAHSGDKEAAVQMLAELEELSHQRYVHIYWRVLLCLSLGNHDEAIRWLEKGITDHEGRDINWIKVDPLLDPLRGDPRFEALVQKVVGPK